MSKVLIHRSLRLFVIFSVTLVAGFSATQASWNCSNADQSLNLKVWTDQGMPRMGLQLQRTSGILILRNLTYNDGSAEFFRLTDGYRAILVESSEQGPSLWDAGFQFLSPKSIEGGETVPWPFERERDPVPWPFTETELKGSDDPLPWPFANGSNEDSILIDQSVGRPALLQIRNHKAVYKIELNCLRQMDHPKNEVLPALTRGCSCN